MPFVYTFIPFYTPLYTPAFLSQKKLVNGFFFVYLCTAFQNGRRQVSAKSLSFTTKKNIDL